MDLQFMYTFVSFIFHVLLFFCSERCCFYCFFFFLFHCVLNILCIEIILYYYFISVQNTESEKRKINTCDRLSFCSFFPQILIEKKIDCFFCCCCCLFPSLSAQFNLSNSALPSTYGLTTNL